MDIKKSPKASLEDKKFLNILLGLVVVLSLVYIGFEWTNKEVKVYEDTSQIFIDDEELDITQTVQDNTPPPPPPPEPDVIEEITIVENDVEVKEVVIHTEETNEQIKIAPPVIAKPVEEDEDNVIFQVVEDQPEFPGGDAARTKFLNDNIKYPAIAAENGVQGQVICQFVVNRDGSIVDIEVVRSVDPSLDKEAIRVIQKMPNWKPGKQRNKPVRVKFTLPIRFRLN